MSVVFPSPSSGLFGRRLRSERGARIPVTIVSGFLGAGKTTLVKQFLARPEGVGTAVVVNEFGEIGIDDALLRSSAEKTVLLGNGCLCCNTRSDLQVALRRLVAERERGAVPHFSRIVIETSGLADLGPILATFLTDRALGGEFHVEVVVTVVSAVDALATLDRHGEARRQVILADRIVLSKADLTGAATLEQLSERLRTLNPRAEVIRADHGTIDPRFLLNASAAARDHNLFTADAVHGDDIRSFVLADDQPMAWNVFARSIEMLMALRGGDLLRVKGFLNVRGCKGPVVVQIVGHLAHPPVELQAWPDSDHRTRVVFLIQRLDERQVRDLFAAASRLAQ